MFNEEFSKVKKELESLKSDIIGILIVVIFIKLCSFGVINVNIFGSLHLKISIRSETIQFSGI